MENVKLHSNRVWIAEDQSDPDALIAKIVICDFSVNKNGVQLNRETIDEWMSSLVNAPLVGRIKAKSNGEIDFTSHNVTVVTRVDEDGSEYSDIEFNTDAFGTFTAVEIEEIDGVECIVATARVWKRFYDASNLILKRINEGTLSTSWEISVEKSNKKIISGSVVKVIDKGRFIGHTLLSSQTEPAYNISRVLEVAATNDDEELCSAIIRDVMSMENNSDGNEVQNMEEVITNEVNIADVPTDEVAEIVETEVVSEVEPSVELEAEHEEVVETVATEPEKAELTMRDLRYRMGEALHVTTGKWLDVIFIFPESKKVWAHDCEEKETDIYEFTYAVDGDEIILTDMTQVTLVVSPRQINSVFDEKNSALVEANNRINELTAEIATLTPYKEQAEKAEKEAAEAKRLSDIAELRVYAEDSKVFSKEELESEEIASLIESLKASEIKAMIADRIVAKAAKAKPEIATKQVKPRLDITCTTDSDPAAILRNFVHR